MEINLEQEKIDIIKKRIMTDERYSGHENLFDLFFEETMKRGFVIFKNMDMTESSANIYLNKVVSSSVIAVLDSQLREAKEFKNPENYTGSDNIIKPQEGSLENSKEVNKYKNTKVAFTFDYTPAIAAEKIKANVLQKFYDTIVLFNSQKPEKEYLQIYNLRYIQKLPISEIAEKLNIPEKEVSQSLFELMEEVKKNLE